MDYLFPKRCLLCNKLLPLGVDICFCDKCRSDIDSYKYVNEIKTEKSRLKVFSAVRYEGNIREYMIDYKFRYVKLYSKSYAYILSKIWERAIINTNDKNYIVVFVPMHRVRQRPYNQSEEIAREFSLMAQLLYDDNVLIKKRGISQTGRMTIKEKQIFLKDAFDVINSWRISGKTVVLIDDIFTTGTTARVCYNLLLNNGARDVIFLTPCYTPYN